MDQGAAHVSNLQQKDLEDRDDQRVAAACCATADTVPFRLIEALLRSVCVVFI